VFTITDRGTVVTGKIILGSVSTLNNVCIVCAKTGETKESVVTSIEIEHKITETAKEGENPGLLLKEINRKDVSKGDYIVKMI